MSADARTMFEIYREGGYNRRVRVIYYTELEEHERDAEIERAARGETLLSGYVRDDEKDEAKALLGQIVDELDEAADEAPPDPQVLRARLAKFLVE